MIRIPESSTTAKDGLHPDQRGSCPATLVARHLDDRHGPGFVSVAHCWQADTGDGERPVYHVGAVRFWGFTRISVDCAGCAASWASWATPPAVRVEHGDGCGKLAALIAQGIRDGVLSADGQARA